MKNDLVLSYDELPAVWVEEITFEKSQFFIKEIIRLDSDPDVSDIFVYISTYGGGAYALLGMIEAMNSCGKPVHTIGLGMCASAGGILLAAGTGTRFLSPNSFLHIHNVQTGIEGDIPDMEHFLSAQKELQRKLFKALLERSSLSSKELTDILKKNREEWHLTAQQAKKYGFIDVIGVPKMKRSIVNEVEW
jgi:ATP-dependent Clp protease protease subunit